MTGIAKKIKWQHVVLMLLIAAVAVGSDGCKSTGKLTKKERKAQIEAAKKELNEIISGTSTKSLEEQNRTVNDIAGKNYNDKDLNHLITQAQQKLKKAFAERDKNKQQKVDEARAKLLDLLLNKEGKSADELQKELDAIKAENLNDKDINDLIARVEQKIASMGSTANVPLKDQIENAFQGIANASKSGDISKASQIIKNTMPLFTGDDATVLIIISREGSIVDYDKPTTIKRYIDFVKDQKASKNAVDSYMLDTNGKIKELDLIKK
jgi:hypothetical protein